MRTRLAAGSFYGTIECRYDVAGLTLAETVYPPALVIPPHEHVKGFLCFLIAGSCDQSCDGRTWIGRPLNLTLFPAGMTHAHRWHDSGGRVLHVEFDASWLQRLGGAAVLTRSANYET